MGACCAKDRNAKIDNQERVLSNNDKGADIALELGAKPLPLQKPSEPDFDTQFLERALVLRSSNNAVNVCERQNHGCSGLWKSTGHFRSAYRLTTG